VSVERLRREYRLTGGEILEKLSMARWTVAGSLARLGLGRFASLEPKAPDPRYQRERPSAGGKRKGLGYGCLHVHIGDATPLAYVLREKAVDHGLTCSRAPLVRGARRRLTVSTGPCRCFRSCRRV
jgi:hypothetical protein